MELTKRAYTDVRLLDQRAAADRLPLPALAAPPPALNAGNVGPAEASA